MGEILSAEEVQRCNSWTEFRSEMWRRLDLLYHSHEALRARLVEVEQERDTYRSAQISTERGMLAAEARLVEVEQALRALLDAPKRPGAAQRRWERDGNTADADLLSEWQKAHDEIVAHARAVLDKGEPDG